MVDDLGLNKGPGGRLLLVLVAAMVILAALGAGGAVAALSLAREWRQGAGATLMVEVPRPDDRLGGGTRSERVLAVLQTNPLVTSAHALDADELSTLLRPWLGGDVTSLNLALPEVIEVRLADARQDARDQLVSQLGQAVPDAVVEGSDDWSGRLLALGRSLAACAILAVVLVLSVAMALVALAASAGLATERETIEILHLLGAADGDISDRFARRLAVLTLLGGITGALLALPLLAEMARLAAPFGVAPSDDIAAQPLSILTVLPPAIWASLALLPIGAAVIGWITAQITVRLWLRRLP